MERYVIGQSGLVPYGLISGGILVAVCFIIRFDVGSSMLGIEDKTLAVRESSSYVQIRSIISSVKGSGKRVNIKSN